MIHLNPTSDSVMRVVVTSSSILLGNTICEYYHTYKLKRNQYRIQRKVYDRLHMTPEQLVKKYGPDTVPL